MRAQHSLVHRSIHLSNTYKIGYYIKMKKHVKIQVPRTFLLTFFIQQKVYQLHSAIQVRYSNNNQYIYEYQILCLYVN